MRTLGAHREVRLLTKRQYRGKYRTIRCALCYRRFWPWQRTVRGANFFPHPYMMTHFICGMRYVWKVDNPDSTG